VIVLAEEVAPRIAEEVLSGPVEPDEPQVLGGLDEDHVRDVLDHRVQERFRAPELLLRVLALGDVQADQHPGDHLSSIGAYGNDLHEERTVVDQPLRRGLLTHERRAILRFGGPHGRREQLLSHLRDGASLQSLLGEADGLQSLAFHQREAQVVIEEAHDPIGEVACKGSIHGLALLQGDLPFGQDRAGALQGLGDPAHLVAPGDRGEEWQAFREPSRILFAPLNASSEALSEEHDARHAAREPRHDPDLDR
jgi:hypothetical protein